MLSVGNNLKWIICKAVINSGNFDPIGTVYKKFTKLCNVSFQFLELSFDTIFIIKVLKPMCLSLVMLHSWYDQKCTTKGNKFFLQKYYILNIYKNCWILPSL